MDESVKIIEDSLRELFQFLKNRSSWKKINLSAKVNIDLPSLSILHVLLEKYPAKLKLVDIAKCLDVEAPFLSRKTKELETSGYIEKKIDPLDKRVSYLIPTQKARLIDVARLLNANSGSNPHFWYNPSYVNAVDNQITLDLERIKPQDKEYFINNLKSLNAKMAVYQNKIKYIADHYKNVKVASTEDIFQYLAASAKLNLISPLPFIRAIAQGSDPPTSSVVTFQEQLTTKQPKILVYNIQTVTPITTEMKKIAEQHNIPVVGITETIQPINVNFETWMNNELNNIIRALNN